MLHWRDTDDEELLYVYDKDSQEFYVYRKKGVLRWLLRYGRIRSWVAGFFNADTLPKRA